MNEMLLNIVAATNTSYTSNSLISPLKFQSSLDGHSPELLDSIDSQHVSGKQDVVLSNVSSSIRPLRDSIDPLLLLDEACGFFDASSSSSPLLQPTSWVIDSRHDFGLTTSSSSSSSSNPSGSKPPPPIEGLIPKAPHLYEPSLGYIQQSAVSSISPLPSIPTRLATGALQPSSSEETSVRYVNVYGSLEHSHDLQASHGKTDPR